MNEQLLRQAIKEVNDQGTDLAKLNESSGRFENYSFDLDDKQDQEEFATKVIRLYLHLERVELAKEGN